MKLKVAIVGTRGIPAKYGGFETFAEELSIRLSQKGFIVNVFCDKDSYESNSYKNVDLVFSKYTKTGNSIKYYNDCITKAALTNDAVIICGTGGALFLLKKYFKNKKTIYITNTDGIEYKRSKWPLWGRVIIKATEILSVLISNYIIADSKGIKQYLLKQYKFLSPLKIRQIEYGAKIVESYNESFLAKHNLSKGEYYLVVSRLEPENNVDTILEGFKKASLNNPLIVVGNLLTSEHVKYLKTFESDKIRFIGGIYDKTELATLRYFCKAYCHGHSVGGTNPSLLEALGCGNIVLAHDNIFNREVTADRMFYFKNVDDVSNMLKVIENLASDELVKLKDFSKNRILDYYNWERITNEYTAFFNEILNHSLINETSNPEYSQVK
jgi:glycosyltransferase involved in cell wall biosynthesis